MLWIQDNYFGNQSHAGGKIPAGGKTEKRQTSQLLWHTPACDWGNVVKLRGGRLSGQEDYQEKSSVESSA